MSILEQGCGALARSPELFSRPGVSEKMANEAVFPQPSSPANLRQKR